MAGHLPIPTKEFHKKKVEEFKTIVGDIKNTPTFKRYLSDDDQSFFRLSSDYFMDEEHGLIDDEVISFTPSSRRCVYEIHLNNKGEINQVYLVM